MESHKTDITVESPSEIDLLSHLRPFSTASSGTTLVQLQVHFGTGFECFADDGILPSTYISASVEKYPGEVSIGVEATIIPQDKRALLKRTLPPFSSTRVVENSLSPYWNEMLLVTIPHSWNNDKEESFLAIKIELIRREKCQQEDYVLGYAMIPSPSLHFECHEKRIKLHFSTGTTDKAPVTLFLSYSICSAILDIDRKNQQKDPTRLEVILSSFMPSSRFYDEFSDCNLASLICISGRSENKGTYEQKSSQEFEELFHPVYPGDHIPYVKENLAPSILTLSSCKRIFETLCEWKYPMIFRLPEGFIGEEHTTMHVHLYASSNKLMQSSGTATAPALQFVGSGSISLTPENCNRSGVLCHFNSIRIFSTHAENGSVEVGTLDLSCRRWEPSSYKDFIQNSRKQRLVHTNRKSIDKKREPQWMGAIIRGINRIPISLFYDEGGLSSVLAEILCQKENYEGDPNGKNISVGRHAITGVAMDDIDLLRNQIVIFQEEIAIKTSQTQRLQQDVDVRTAAIKTCGVELVKLRRELRRRDDELQMLRQKTAEFEIRDKNLFAEMSQISEKMKGVDGGQATQRCVMLLARYKKLEIDYEAALKKLDQSSELKNQLLDKEQRLAELEKAHMIQAALVQRLQQTKQRIAVYKKTVQMQEEVIRQFEAMVGSPQGPSIKEADSELNSKNVNQKEKESIESFLAVRVKILEDQLRTNAKAAASEISELKMRIFELEMRNVTDELQ